MPDTDQSIDDLKSRIDRSRRTSWLLTILAAVAAVVVTVGFAAYSVSGIIKRNIELTAQFEQLTFRSKELQGEREEYENVKLVFSELLAKLSEAEGVDDPKYDTNMESLVKQANARIVELNRQIKENKIDKPVQDEGYTESEMEAIRDAIKVEQTATPTEAPAGRKDEGRNWYRITYKVTMKPLAEPVTHDNKTYRDKNIIYRVEYHFNKRWYNPSMRLGGNRTEDFVYSTRVWGVTAVKVAISVKGFDGPIIRQHLMSLSKDSIP